MPFIFVLVVSLLSLKATPYDWPALAKDQDYLQARQHLSDFLPDQAIPPLLSLLQREDLTPKARLKLRLLLAEAYLRNGQAASALDQLAAADVPQEVPELLHQVHFLRGHAYLMEAKYSQALPEFTAIGSGPLQLPATLAAARIRALFGETEHALSLLRSLDTAHPDVRSTTLALLLDSGELDAATDLLEKVQAPSPLERYLTGRLELLRGDRLRASATFRKLLAETPSSALGRPLRDATLLSLSDSLALAPDPLPSLTLLLDHLRASPRSPLLQEIMTRIRVRSPLPVPQALRDPLEQWARLPEENQPSSPLTLASLETLGLLLLRGSGSEADTGAALLDQTLSRLPSHATSRRGRILLALADDLLNQQKNNAARLRLQELAALSPRSHWEALAQAKLANLDFAEGDPEKATQLLKKASTLVTGPVADAIRTNLYLTLLASSSPQLPSPALPEDPSPHLLLEAGLILADRRNPAARSPLQSFIEENPEHPRLSEARLALMENASQVSPQDLEIVRQQLRLLDPDLSEAGNAARWLLTALTLDEGAGQARLFLKKYPQHPQAPRLLFELAQHYQRIQQPGEAYRRFEQLIEAHPDDPLSDPARLLSARTAFATNTPGADEKVTFQRYQELIDRGGPLAPDAMIEKAEAHLRYQEHAEALATLAPLLDLQDSPLNYRRALLLAAAAARASRDFQAELTYYQTLLQLPELPPSWQERALYRSGKAHESLHQPSKALTAYLKIIEPALKEETSRENWNWFDRAALSGALPLLERENRWKAAHRLAERIAQSASPIASKEAARRATALQEEHQVQ